MKLVFADLKQMVWLLARVSLILLTAADCAFRPPTAVSNEPRSDVARSFG